MEDKQTRVMLVLATLLVALVLLIRFAEAPEPEAEDDGLHDLIEVQPDQVRSLELTTAEGTLTAERTDAGWVLLSPLQARGDDGQLDELISVADRLQVGDPLEGADPANYGLDAPIATLAFTLLDGTSHSLKIGARAPVGFKTYLSLDDSGVLVGSGEPGEALKQPFGALRDAQVVRLAASAVDRVVYSAAGVGWQARKNGQGWWLEDGRRASEPIIEGLLATAQALRFESWWEELPLPEAELLPPRASLSFWEGEAAQTLNLGGMRAGGVLVQNPDGIVGSVAESAELELALSELLESRLIALAAGPPDRLSVELDGVSSEWAWSLDGWSRDGEPLSDPAFDPERWTVAAEADRAATFDDLGTRSGRVEVAQGQRSVVIRLGDTVEGGRIGQEEAGGPTFLVSAASVQALEQLLASAP